LKLMCRYNNVEKMKEVFHRIKKFNPDIFLHTHCICGFPTETEKEFNDTLEFFKEIDINSCFFYVFSCKTGTPAEKMQQVPEQKISIRFKHAKKYLKKLGYVVITLSKSHFYAYKKYSNIKARNSIKVHPKKEMKIIIEPKR
jgi:tRNA A37 methylthiotransferase MiaB